MNTEILSADKDPMGAAILDFQKHGKAARLRVLSSMFEEDEMPVTHLFRSTREMPVLEQKALQLAKGRVLDIGAGSGCHTLALQEKGLEVKAIDISPLSCEAMKLRGVKDAECINLFDDHLGTGFDTILLLMNGTGIAGKIEHLPALFLRLKALLNPGGQILIDSSDLKYIYENEDGSFDINLNGAYYGEGRPLRLALRGFPITEIHRRNLRVAWGTRGRRRTLRLSGENFPSIIKAIRFYSI